MYHTQCVHDAAKANEQTYRIQNGEFLQRIWAARQGDDRGYGQHFINSLKWKGASSASAVRSIRGVYKHC